MNLELVEQIVGLMGEYPLTEISVEEEGRRVCVRRSGTNGAFAAPPAAPPAAPQSPLPVWRLDVAARFLEDDADRLLAQVEGVLKAADEGKSENK